VDKNIVQNVRSGKFGPETGQVRSWGKCLRLTLFLPILQNLAGNLLWPNPTGSQRAREPVLEVHDISILAVTFS
jgi:hypothetical protein